MGPFFSSDLGLLYLGVLITGLGLLCFMMKVYNVDPYNHVGTDIQWLDY